MKTAELAETFGRGLVDYQCEDPEEPYESVVGTVIGLVEVRDAKLQADARREPLEVLRECHNLIAGCYFGSERTRRLRDGIKALLADAPVPERTEPTPEQVRDACSSWLRHIAVRCNCGESHARMTADELADELDARTIDELLGVKHE